VLEDSKQRTAEYSEWFRFRAAVESRLLVASAWILQVDQYGPGAQNRQNSGIPIHHWHRTDVPKDVRTTQYPGAWFKHRAVFRSPADVPRQADNTMKDVRPKRVAVLFIP